MIRTAELFVPWRSALLLLGLLSAGMAGVLVTSLGAKALAVPVAVGALVLMVRHPELYVVSLFALFHLMNLPTLMRLGVESTGFTLGDLALVVSIPIVLAHVLGRRGARVLGSQLAKAMLAFSLVGTALLIYGWFKGAPIRSVMNEYRTFVYLPLIVLFLALLVRTKAQVFRCLVALYAIVFIEFILIALGRLDPLTWERSYPISVLPKTAWESAWHFIQPSYIALSLVAVGILVFARRELTPWARVGLYSFVAASAAVFVLSYNRGHWLSMAGTLVAAFFWSRIRRKFSSIMGRALAVGLVAVTVLVVAQGPAGSTRLAGAVYRRFVSGTQVTTDMSARTRTEDMKRTVWAGLRSPLWGHGLGVGRNNFSFYLSGMGVGISGGGLHMTYAYLFYRGGLILLGVFIYMLFSLFRLPARAFKRMGRRGLESGFLAGGSLALIFYVLWGTLADWVLVGNGLVGFSTLAGLLFCMGGDE